MIANVFRRRISVTMSAAMRRVLAIFLASCGSPAPVEVAQPLPPSPSAPPTTANGAPVRPLLDVGDGGELVVPTVISFRTNSDELLPESEPTLQRIVEFMSARRDVTLLRVEGHSDSMGMAAYNRRMTDARAHAAAKW